MKQHILKDIINTNRRTSTQRELLNLFIRQGEATIPELSKNLGISIPTVTKSLNDLIDKGLVHEVGKRDNSSGRIPTIYDLIPSSGYFVGVDPTINSLAFGLCDFCGNIVYKKTNIPFRYYDSPECLDMLESLLTDFIKESPVDKNLIYGVCMNVAERVNTAKGTAYDKYTFLDKPLAQAMTEAIGYPVYIENDSRSMTYGEYLKGCCRGEKNVVFVNIGWGLGMGMIIDGKLYSGKSGYSGEIGHMSVYDNDIICHCGKLGCMETEVSGLALQRKLTQLLLDGGQSILSDKVANQKQSLTLPDILDAIAKEDVICIEALQEVANELGKNLAGIINIFNPELLVIGGDLSVTGDYLTQPVRMGIKKYSLNVVNEDSRIVTSDLKDQAGLVGACLMARHKLLAE